VSKLRDYYGLNHLHYLTTSTHRRARLFDSELNYMHNHPVKRGLVRQPGDWPWSSGRFCFLNDISLLPMDRVP
jgi:hypothetical protein